MRLYIILELSKLPMWLKLFALEFFVARILLKTIWPSLDQIYDNNLSLLLVFIASDNLLVLKFVERLKCMRSPKPENCF